MWQRFIEWIKRVWGKKADDPTIEETYAKRYENLKGENITATIANKLAKLTLGDTTVEIDGSSKRVDLIRDTLQHWWDNDAGWTLAQAYGKGGKVIVPTVSGDEVLLNIIDQSRLLVSKTRGDAIISATVIADITKWDDKTYYRLVDYTLEDNGRQVIKTRIFDESNAEVPLKTVPQWATIAEEITISNTDRLLLALLKCPRDNRKDGKVYGVPITYGAENDIEELVEHIATYRREYRLTRPMLGLDATLWRQGPTGAATGVGGLTISQVRQTVQDGDDPFIPVTSSALGTGAQWDYYAPAIRSDAMEVRLQSLYRRVERACGLSQGILTERSAVSYANKDEVRAALYDTFATITEMRKNVEQALDNVAYSIDVLAEAFGLTPAGGRDQYEINIDWDMSLIESSSETFAQLHELQRGGMVSKAELRQWVRGGTEKEAEKAVEEITKQAQQEAQQAGALDQMLAGMTAAAAEE